MLAAPNWAGGDWVQANTNNHKPGADFAGADFVGPTLIVLAVAAALRLVLAANLGLGIDETYTVATSRQLALSYFDHPPLAWWLVGLVRNLAQSESPFWVRLPFVALFFATGWMLFLLTRLVYDARSAFFAVLAVSCAPVIGVTTGTFVLPDGPLVLAMVSGAYCLARATLGPSEKEPVWWLAAGLCGGLALMSKYHGIFLFCGTGLFLLTSPAQRRWFAQPWPYLGFAIAVVLFLPVLFWNAENNWVSFLFQSGRGGPARLRLLAPLTVIGGQALFLLPWIWFGLVATGISALRKGPREPASWLLFCLAIGPIVTFTLVSLWSSTRVFPHWSMPGYLMLFPLLGAAISRRWDDAAGTMRLWAKGSVALTTFALLFVSAAAHVGWPPAGIEALKRFRDPLVETATADNIRDELGKRGYLGKPGLFVTGLKWFNSAQLDYALAGALPVTCVCDDPRGYGVLAPADKFIGQDAIIVMPVVDERNIQDVLGSQFETIEPLGAVDMLRAGKPSVAMKLFLGHKLRPGWRPPWLMPKPGS
jgi:hypothetical protein